MALETGLAGNCRQDVKICFSWLCCAWNYSQQCMGRNKWQQGMKQQGAAASSSRCCQLQCQQLLECWRNGRGVKAGQDMHGNGMMLAQPKITSTDNAALFRCPVVQE